MAILKNELDNNFTQIPNEIICSNLSDKAFRLLIYLYSKKNNWKVYQDYVAKELNTSRQTVNKYFRELKEKGFLEIEQIRTIDGFDYEYRLVVSSSVDTRNRGVNNCGVNVGKCQGTFTHSNTNLSNTNLSNTDIKKHYFESEVVDKAFKEFLKSRPKKKNTELSIKKLINNCKGFTDQEITDAIDFAIASGWDGFFPKKSFKAYANKEAIVPDWLNKDNNIEHTKEFLTDEQLEVYNKNDDVFDVFNTFENKKEI